MPTINLTDEQLELLKFLVREESQFDWRSGDALDALMAALEEEHE